MTWCMRISCYIPKATNTHSGCVILITFLLQQWFQKRVSMVGYTYIACLVIDLRTNSDYFPIHHELISFYYNRD